MNYRETLNLPKTDFPMRAGLSKKEPLFIEKWENEKLYKKIRENRKGKDLFILHDGPPYANGRIHMGHALNKILKDIIVKMKTMQGFDAPYIPGWDCHGLPIEHQVVKKLGKKKKDTSQDELRKMCREYAKEFIELQKIDFKRLGVFADYDDPYLTMSQRYEAGIVQAFGDLVKKGYIYKGLKPIHWCSNCNTALAEAEIEYNENHVSPSIYVKFPIVNRENEYVLIWTTTPWTLPANVAITLHEHFEYRWVINGNEKYVVASELIDQIIETTGIELKKGEVVTKEEIESFEVKHPFIDRESKMIYGDHVTLETGTGCVHTAPGHGQEDYIVSLKYNLPIISPVNERGVFTEEAGEWAGQFVFKANDSIVEKLKSLNVLLFTEKYPHSYPICWRCKKELIFRATPQWFMNLQDSEIKEKALEAVKKVKWVPNWGELRMSNMLEGRPDWCLSRQRAWGVPIPAFYCEDCRETYMTPETVDYFAKIVEKDGVDIWFQWEAEKLLPEGSACPKCGGKKFQKENDILDVWFDSGVSHICVLQKRDIAQIADVYLEGSDQYRGWFQSSLWPAIGLMDKAPYKEVITHGFMLDEKGKAMSKSVGNVIAPEKIINKYGADILRLWVVSENYQDNIKLGDNLLQQVADAYKKIRFTLRFLLSNLYDYDDSKHRVEYKDYDLLAKWATSRLGTITKQATDYYNKYSFYRAFSVIHNFCIVDMSNFYLDVIKDIMYSEGTDSTKRRMHQTILFDILNVLTKLLAPILSFTCEEVYNTFHPESDSIHLENFPNSEMFKSDESLEAQFKTIMDLKNDVYKAIEDSKSKEIVGNNLESKVKIYSDDNEKLNQVKSIESELKEFLIVSGLSISDKAIDDSFEGKNGFKVKVDKADGEKCERCWIYYDSVGSHSDHPTLCDRCYSVVANK